MKKMTWKLLGAGAPVLLIALTLGTPFASAVPTSDGGGGSTEETQAPSGTVPTPEQILVDLKEFDSERREMRNDFVKKIILTFTYYYEMRPQEEKLKELLVDIAKSIQTVRERVEGMTYSERALWADTHDGIPRQLEEARKQYDVIEGHYRGFTAHYANQEERFERLFDWIIEVRKQYGKGPERKTHKGSGLMFWKTYVDSDDEIIPGKWAFDLAEKGQIPDLAEQYVDAEFDIDEGDADDDDWASKQPLIEAVYKTYLEETAEDGEFKGYQGCDPENKEKTGEWEQLEEESDATGSGGSGGGFFNIVSSWMDLIRRYAEQMGAQVREGEDDTGSIASVFGEEDGQGGSGESTGGEGAAADSDDPGAPTSDGSDSGTSTTADSSGDGSSSSGDGTATDTASVDSTPTTVPTAGQAYTVQSGDTLGDIVNQVLARVPDPKPSAAEVWAPGGLVDNLASHLGIGDPNMIVTGTVFRLPPPDFFQS